MDSLMLAITTVSVVVALVSAGTAWRVVDRDRRRRAARVAALAAAAGVDPARRMGVGAGSAPAVTEVPPATAVPDGLHEFMPARDKAAEPPVPAVPMFARPVADSGSGNRQHRLLAAAAVAGVLAIGAAGVLLVSGRGPGATEASVRPPLELLALGHARADGQLTVSGVVRNPAASGEVRQVLAEVRVFDAAGLLISSKRVAIDLPALAPGHESPFAVTLGEASTAARYRVSFSSEGSMLSHVDRRSNLPAAVTADAR